MIKQLKFLALLFFLPLFFEGASAQTSKNSKDTTSLVEGVYISSDQFLKQQPSYTPAQLNRTNATTHYSIRSWSNKDSLYIYINQHKQAILRESVWGFYDDGNLFLQHNGYFHKVTLLGSISLFTEIYPLIKAPFTPVTTDETKEIIPSMIDLHSGKMYLLAVKSLLELLKSDETLLNNFTVLTKKTRKKMMYSYIERFNDRHPLF